MTIASEELVRSTQGITCAARHGLSQFRYHAWTRKEQCELDDSPFCPQNMPHQLTPDEVAVIENFVTCDDYRNSGYTRSATGKVFASSKHLMPIGTQSQVVVKPPFKFC